MINIPKINSSYDDMHIAHKFGINELMIKIFSYIYQNFPPGKINNLRERGYYFDGEDCIQNFRNNFEKNDWSNIEYNLNLFIVIDNHIIPFTQIISITITHDYLRINFEFVNTLYQVELQNSFLNTDKHYDLLSVEKNKLLNDIKLIQQEIKSCIIPEKLEELYDKENRILNRIRHLEEEILILSESKEQYKNWVELRELLLHCELFNAIVDPPFVNKKILTTFIFFYG